ncbi:sodium-coupled neutral amino acid transporter 9 isoform X2 [Zalophus californianus]|uniref:Neutral amino acid transporter 9 n=1 Tax=Zalophus californianus TaxID=9704 RepID=A0A6J2E144_ZALCA|nr:sodium-coupled neutral amino acid transporter 9 isoform X2 [Zalophus californianus]XP_027462519.1 sodium-coupled neutral amino acid transporter 9 isoform X2 [Zalophus californianus]XP_027462520.1 sodium-coupled neutral amino acid transporter 9 isoform X2 [Zalophus californianus]XP_027462521.1 sodium-coupled neutral amino acid transporter 9 isoform X2 [Zalophus californianus]XP_027462522.1 sodium-coupled neutral amino acid transporter 9 isoform X2 [Zalophus californianus]
MEDKKLFSSMADFQNFWLNVLCQVYIPFSRPFYIEPTNIINVNDVIQRVSDHASAMNKRIHYYSRLTAPADKALIAPDHVVPAPEECYVYSPLGSAYKLQSYTEGYGKNTSLVTIFMIWNTMMGTSILSIPWGIKQAGFTTGMCVIMLMGILTLYCCYRVVKSRAMISSVDTTTWEYPDVCRYYFGSFGQWSSLLFSLVSLIGAMIVYWVLMSNFLFNTGRFIFNFIHHINDTDAVLSTNDSNPVICPSAGSNDHPDNGSMIFYANDTGLQQFEKWWNKSKTVPFYLIGLLLPLLNFKSPSFFSKFNILGTVSVLYLIFLVTFKAIHLGFHLEFHWLMQTEYFVPEIRFQFPQLTGVLTLAFFIHNCIITLLKNNKNQENNVRDLSIAYMLVTLTYLYIGVLVFASFPSPPLTKDCIEQNFLDNFPSSDILSFIARIFLLFQMMTVYPLLGYLARVQLLGHVFGDIYPSIFHVLILNLIIVGTGVIMACFYPNIGGIIRYSGAACGLAFVFIYPSLIYIISLRREDRLTWPKLIFHIFIIILGLANLIVQFFM